MEYLDIVDSQNKVIGKAPRADIYQYKLPHRIVHVLVFNEKRELLLQRRSKQAGYRPLHWGTSAGGHVQSGEDYKQAAQREYLEELGARTEVKPVGTFFYGDPLEENKGLSRFITVFYTLHNGPFLLEQKELHDAHFLSLEEIKRKVKGGEPFTPQLLYVLHKFLKIPHYNRFTFV